LRQVLIVSNDAVFQTVRRSGGDVPDIEHSRLPANVSILVGRRSLLFGGGPTRRGYVMLAGNAIGMTAVKASDVRRGALTLK